MALTPVLLPGNMCDARLWHGDNDILRKMLATHNMEYVFDADIAQDDSIADMAKRTLAAAKGPLLLIGFSMGAIVAVEMAMQAPDRIAGLVLAGYNATADLPERAAHRPMQQAEVRSGGLERVLVEELKPNYLAAQGRNDKALLTLLRDMGIALGADVFIRQSEALRLRDDRRNVLPQLDMPVLYMCGEEDTLCPPAWHQNWTELTPLSRFEEIACAGHMLPLEAPGAFARAIENWLKHNEREFA
jgi:pimeloyl-ACP methyl ester carboxylesterase